MKIKYLDELDRVLSILKDKNHVNHRIVVSNYKKTYGYKNCEEIILQVENRRKCLVWLIENFSQKDYEMLFCIQSLDRKTRHRLYKAVLRNFAFNFALSDYALANSHNCPYTSWWN